MLAGGHSLIPMMKLRLASPANLVDLGGIADLKGIRQDGDEIVIGAMTTQHELIALRPARQDSPAAARDRAADRRPAGALLRHARRQRGERRSRQRHAGRDALPERDLSGRAARAASTASQARKFYQGAYFTALAPGEIVTAIRIPVPPAGHGFAYQKLKRKIGDYATAAAAVVLTMDGGGAVGSCRDRAHQRGRDAALRREAGKRLVVGSKLDAATVKQAVAAAEAITAPASDRRGTPQYRTKMAGVMVARALARAAQRARGE